MSWSAILLLVIWAAVSFCAWYITRGQLDDNLPDRLFRWSLILFWWVWMAISIVGIAIDDLIARMRGWS